MAIQVSNAFVTLFDSEVKQAYQGQRMLAGAVRERSGVEGSTVKFPKIGKGSATLRIPQTDVTPLNVSYSQVTATPPSARKTMMSHPLNGSTSI